MSDKPRILLVDLSGILHRNYAVNAGKGDVDAAANQTLSHVRWLSSQYDHVAICCDSGRSFRHEIAKQIREWDPEHKGYKGKRPEVDPVLTPAGLGADLAKVVGHLCSIPIFEANIMPCAYFRVSSWFSSLLIFCALAFL